MLDQSSAPACVDAGGRSTLGAVTAMAPLPSMIRVGLQATDAPQACVRNARDSEQFSQLHTARSLKLASACRVSSVAGVLKRGNEARKSSVRCSPSVASNRTLW